MTELQNLGSALRVFEEVSPLLHHLGASLQVKRMVIGGAHGVPVTMCQLQFDVLVGILQFHVLVGILLARQ